MLSFKRKKGLSAGLLLLILLCCSACGSGDPAPPGDDTGSTEGEIVQMESPTASAPGAAEAQSAKGEAQSAIGDIIVITTTEGGEALAADLPISREAADNLVQEFAAALNAQDAARVFSCMARPDEDYYALAWAEAALEHYRVYFDEEKIVRAELIGPAAYHEGLVYRLYTAADHCKEIYVNARYTGGEHRYDELFIYDNILFYAYRAGKYLNFFLQAIKQQQPEEIARLLTLDDYANPYPQSKAEQVIAQYAAQFDLASLNWAFVGTKTPKVEAGELIYLIRGTKDNAPVEHEITLSYGDGLVGINDSWIPPKQ